MFKVRISNDSNRFHDIGLDVQKRILTYMHSNDKRNFALTETRILHAFHPDYLMLQHLQDRLRSTRAQMPPLTLFNVTIANPTIWREYLNKMESTMAYVFSKLEKQISLPLTRSMKDGSKGEQFVKALMMVQFEVSLTNKGGIAIVKALMKHNPIRFFQVLQYGTDMIDKYSNELTKWVASAHIFVPEDEKHLLPTF